MQGSAITYSDALAEAMRLLAADARTLFVGQAVRYPGQAAFKTFEYVPDERRIEMPVAENFQLGFCTGLALAGYLPISFFPRMDFLILACDALINHLDKLPHMGYRPKVIIRTAIGRRTPLDPGPQHVQNHSEAFRMMLTTIPVVEMNATADILPAYRAALLRDGPSIMVERMECY